MKKVFLVLFASAAFSIGGCKSSSHEDNSMDSTEMKNTVNEAMDSVKSMNNAPMDTTQKMMPDTTKKM